MGERHLYKIMGLSYRSNQIQKLFEAKSARTTLLLRREPENEVDKNAIAIYAALTISGSSQYDWHKIGYVERAIANDEFRGLPFDHVMEATKVDSDHFQLTGKLRKYT